MDEIEQGRRFLKAWRWREARALETDQKRGIPHPPLQKPVPEGAQLVELVDPERFSFSGPSVVEAIARRRSHRSFSQEPLTLEEVSFLLWATQGVQRIVREGIASLRTVPSAGARHPFETYLAVLRVQGLKPGLYRYLPLDHKLVFLRAEEGLEDKISEACLGQRFVGEAAVVWAWVAVPYRTEWRYSVFSHKVIAIDAGHVCQNLYLACEVVGAGTCGVGAYDQAKADALFGLDGNEEFVVYLAPVGKLPQSP